MMPFMLPVYLSEGSPGQRIFCIFDAFRVQSSDGSRFHYLPFSSWRFVPKIVAGYFLLAWWWLRELWQLNALLSLQVWGLLLLSWEEPERDRWALLALLILRLSIREMFIQLLRVARILYVWVDSHLVFFINLSVTYWTFRWRIVQIHRHINFRLWILSNHLPRMLWNDTRQILLIHLLDSRLVICIWSDFQLFSFSICFCSSVIFFIGFQFFADLLIDWIEEE